MMIAAESRNPDDADLLAAIRDMFGVIDPVPPSLPDRIRLALAFRDLEAEMARFSCAADKLALAARGAEESRIVTFDSDSLTIMIRVDANPDGTVRVDGWLAPPHPRPVEMKLTDSSITVTADELGRFVFYSVPRGTAQLIVRPQQVNVASERSDGDFGAMTLVVTPALTLLAGERRHRNGVRRKLTARGCGRATPATRRPALGGCVLDWPDWAGVWTQRETTVGYPNNTVRSPPSY